MRLFCLIYLTLSLTIATAANAADIGNSPQELEVLRTQVLLRQSVLDQARARVTHARLRLNDLTTRRQLAEANRTKVTPIRNPHWEVVQRDLRAAEEVARRLAEKLAPAHPEMQAVESEVRSLRERLAATSEFQDSPVDELRFDSTDLDLESKQTDEIQAAEQELRQAEEEWQTVNRDYQQSISNLASWKPTPIAQSKPEIKEFAQYPTWPVWAVAGLSILAVGVIAVNRRLQSPDAESSAERHRSVERRPTRIIYKPLTPSAGTVGQQQPRLDVSPSLPNRRAPIVPRRRNASSV